MEPSSKQRAAAEREARRIQGELDDLDDSYAEDGIVRTVLRERVEQEKRRARGEEPSR